VVVTAARIIEPTELAALSDEIARLSQDRAELRRIMDAFPVGILIRDRETRFLYVNTIGASGYGIPPEQLVGRAEADVTPPGNDDPEWSIQDLEVIDSGKPRVDPERRFKAYDGRVSILHITRYPVEFAGQRAVMVVPFDLTNIKRLMDERAALERKVLATQRLESLGLMAGGIAHDFNNLLVGVLANADLALADSGTGERARVFIQRVKAAAQRLATLSQKMLAYSGRGQFTSELLDLSAETAELLQLLEATIPKNVRLSTELQQDPPPVRVDPAHIRQVIMNLVTNAAEAIGSRPGTVRIAVGVEQFVPAQYSDLTLGAALRPGDYLCLRVSDDGGGMDPPTRERIFDPFFTTKSSGRGLGLAAVLGIVRAHRGALHVSSRPDAGTTFRIWLPTARDSRPPAAAPGPPAAAVAASGTRVLVVDDEAIVRQATSAVLEAHGFRVATAEDGDRAVEMVRVTPDLEAVVLDMTMPGRPVADTHAAIRALRPELPVVLASGFTEQEVVDELLRKRATVFVQKPFSAQELLEKLAGLLARRSG
jgi:PAS domain S-box-containing protein